MKIHEGNFIGRLRSKDEKALDYVIDAYGWLIKSIVKKHLNKLEHLQDECINDILLSVWYHIDNFIVNDQNGKEVKWVSGHENWVSAADSFNGTGTQIYIALDENTTKLKITPVIKAVSRPKEGNGEETVDYKKVLEEQAFEVIIK